MATSYTYTEKSLSVDGHSVLLRVIKTPLVNIQTETIGKKVFDTNYIGINGGFFDADNGYDNPPTGGSSICYNLNDVGNTITVGNQTLACNYDYNESSDVQVDEDIS